MLLLHLVHGREHSDHHAVNESLVWQAKLDDCTAIVVACLMEWVRQVGNSQKLYADTSKLIAKLQ